jgi:hypothetical protein
MAKKVLILLLAVLVYAAVLIFAQLALLHLVIDPPTSMADVRSFVPDLVDAFDDADVSGWIVIQTLVLLVTQAAFLLPVATRRPPSGTRSKSLTISLLLGAGLAALLTTGLVTALVELIDVLVEPDRALIDTALIYVPIATLALSWIGWGLAFVVYSRDIWPDRALGRLSKWLFAGSIIEALLVIPLDVMVRRRTDCYCSTGTFYTLSAATMAATWLAGPAVAIIFLRGRHRAWRRSRCGRCGHHMGPTPGAACPECGHPWRAPTAVTP